MLTPLGFGTWDSLVGCPILLLFHERLSQVAGGKWLLGSALRHSEACCSTTTVHSDWDPGRAWWRAEKAKTDAPPATSSLRSLTNKWR